MKQYTLDILCRTVGGTLYGDPVSSFSQISVDSRTLYSPEETLFIALRGERHDGHKYILELARKGVRSLMVEEIPPDQEFKEKVNYIKTGDTLAAFHKFIKYHRSQFSIPVIGITGSNGKTIVKEWLYQMLQNSKKVIRSPKSYNSQVGVPLSVWLLDSTYDLAIFEAGISRKGEMQNLQSIIRPDIGIITNVKEAHQENFRDYEEKTREKLILFRECKTIIYCRDHELIHRIAAESFEKERCITWSVKEPADIFIL
jgi:alanine racemase